MDAMSDPRVKRVVIQSSSQVGKSEILLNILGFFVAHDPSPVMLLQPTLEMAEAFSKDRLAPMIRDTPALRGKFADPRSRDSGNTLLHKKYPGGHITLAGANSPASLASRPIRIVLADEVDRYPASAGTEGDPVTLVMKRNSTFFNAKELLTSTPTVAGASRIESAYEESDQSKFFIPCPHCDVHFVIEFENLKWTEGKPLSGQDGRQVRTADAAWLECPHCDGKLDDVARLRALKSGTWDATAEFRGTRGFWLWEAYSPWSSCLKIANAWLAAQGRPEQLKAFVNTTLGRTWRETGEAPDEEKLLSRCEDYPIGKVPNGGLVLTFGADVQADRIEAQVVAWGRGKESWLVDNQILLGDTSRLDSPAWIGLASLLNKSFPHASGGSMNISMGAIDSGFQAQTVYAWARQQGQSRVLVIKGSDTGVALLGSPKMAETKRDGKRMKRGFRVWPVNVSMAKSELYGWLRQERPATDEPFPPGWCHFPQMTLEFFRQLTAEQYVFRIHKGFRKGEWVKTRERNEALDTRIYARAAAERVGISRMHESDWRRLEEMVDGMKDSARRGATPPPVEPTAQQPPPPAPAPPPQTKPKPAGWGHSRPGWFSR